MNHHETLAVVGSIHGNELLGQKVHRAIEADRAYAAAGIVSTEGHPDALAAGKRYLGDAGELGSLLPGDAESPNPDRRAAARLHGWLSGQNAWLAVSIHNNAGTTKGPEFLAVGARTSLSQLAVGRVMGLLDIMVMPGYALHETHPEVVETEHAVRDEAEQQQKVADLVDYVMLIQELGPDGMAELYSDGEGLRFYLRIGSFLLEKNGRPNQFILDRLDRLEATFAGRDPMDVTRFEPLPLPEDLAAELGLDGLELAVGTWNYVNMSRPVNRGTSVLGLPRREVLGSCLVQTRPQIHADGSVTFPSLGLNTSHWR